MACSIVSLRRSKNCGRRASSAPVVRDQIEQESESHVAYTAGMFSAACTLVTLTEFTVATAAFAIDMSAT